MDVAQSCQRPGGKRYRTGNGRACRVSVMNSLDRRPVLVAAQPLHDHLQLARLAAERLDSTDPALADALRAATAAVQAEAVLDA